MASFQVSPGFLSATFAEMPDVTQVSFHSATVLGRPGDAASRVQAANSFLRLARKHRANAGFGSRVSPKRS